MFIDKLDKDFQEKLLKYAERKTAKKRDIDPNPTSKIEFDVETLSDLNNIRAIQANATKDLDKICDKLEECGVHVRFYTTYYAGRATHDNRYMTVLAIILLDEGWSVLPLCESYVDYSIEQVELIGEVSEKLEKLFNTNNVKEFEVEFVEDQKYMEHVLENLPEEEKESYQKKVIDLYSRKKDIPDAE